MLGILLLVSCSAPQSVASPSSSATIPSQTATIAAQTATVTAVPAATVDLAACIAGSGNPACPPRAEIFVDRLAAALEASDYVALRPLVTSTGFIGALNGSEGGQPMTPDQLIDRLQRGTPDGKLRVTVARRPIAPTTRFLPPGDLYVVSTFSQFDGQAQQNVYLIMRSENATMYWSGALYNAP